MFPTLDPGLVRTLLAEAASAQQVIDTLLALAAAATTQDVPPAARTGPRKPSVQDHLEFPLLTSSDGWQVLPARLDLEDDAIIGTGWSDLAKSVAEKAAPKISPPARAPRSKKAKAQRDEEEAQEPGLPTEYEHRHLAGERRVSKKKLYGRGSLHATAAAVFHGEEADEVLQVEES